MNTFFKYFRKQCALKRPTPKPIDCNICQTVDKTRSYDHLVNVKSWDTQNRNNNSKMNSLIKFIKEEV